MRLTGVINATSGIVLLHELRARRAVLARPTWTAQTFPLATLGPPLTRFSSTIWTSPCRKNLISHTPGPSSLRSPAQTEGLKHGKYNVNLGTSLSMSD